MHVSRSVHPMLLASLTGSVFLGMSWCLLVALLCERGGLCTRGNGGERNIWLLDPCCRAQTEQLLLMEPVTGIAGRGNKVKWQALGDVSKKGLRELGSGVLNKHVRGGAVVRFVLDASCNGPISELTK